MFSFSSIFPRVTVRCAGPKAGLHSRTPHQSAGGGIECCGYIVAEGANPPRGRTILRCNECGLMVGTNRAYSMTLPKMTASQRVHRDNRPRIRGDGDVLEHAVRGEGGDQPAAYLVP
jgi:hypothetical protein